jgi:hypothetical protein
VPLSVTQVEQLLDEIDLNVRVTRADFETLSADLLARVPAPLLRVAELAGVPLVRPRCIQGQCNRYTLNALWSAWARRM